MPSPLPPRRAEGLCRRRVVALAARAGLAAAATLAVGAAGLAAAPAWANGESPGVEVQTLSLRREDGSVMLDFDLRVTLSAAAEDALRRGLPLYFTAQATLLRARWYWRDERVARVERQWRVSFQPLTGVWRVSLGSIGQSHSRLEDALAAVSRLARWEIAEGQRVNASDRHYAEFSWRLDTGQLPRPMQFGIGGGGDWALGVERTLRLEP